MLSPWCPVQFFSFYIIPQETAYSPSTGCLVVIGAMAAKNIVKGIYWDWKINVYS
jgi:hypothetical protein